MKGVLEMGLIDFPVAMIIIVAIPLVIGIGFLLRNQVISLQRKEKLRKRLNEMTKFIHFDSCKKEYFSDKLLVLDEVNKKVIFLDYFNYKNNTIIDLHDLKDCKLLVRRLAVQLELKFENSCRDACRITFYQRFVDPGYRRSNLTAKARRWKDLITKAIANNREFEYGISG
ncbi:hypothetical protein WG906_17390 [Pedobacter sp. P351]|uniref:hypothetical protein n=1 Tax=Pedobacter superstes TaxID=3133441 RepID=UPI0030A845AE